MAPTPRNNHVLGGAGLSSEEIADGKRGRRYFHVATGDWTGSVDFTHKDALARPNAFCRDSSERTIDDQCGLSSVELGKNYDLNQRRGRRHICHGQSIQMACKTPTEPSLASEPISEDSAADHLGHRTHIQDDRWKAALEASTLQEEEPCGGSTSHHLHNKGKLGFGKRHFGKEVKYTGYHRALSMADPGGADAYEINGGSFLGAQKKKIWGSKFQVDDAFGDTIDPKERSTKRMFKEKIEEAAHATEDIPIGVSSQIDLHTRGFLGASKRSFGGMMQASSDPVMDLSSEPANPNDLSSYGLNHRGKRKFLVQSNLESGCRHNLERPEGQYGPGIGRSASVPVLDRERPPNETPYWQDSLPDEERANKKELPYCCGTGHELDRDIKPRKGKNLEDNTWSCLAWTPRKVDDMTATRFIEGQDAIHAVTDDEYREAEFRESLGKTKRSYGNAHNKSEFRFDYNDDPGRKMEHFVIVNQHLACDQEDDKRLTERALMWGKGHGRKKFGIKDHLDKDDDGVECYLSASGAVLGKVKHKKVEDHLDRNAGVTLDFRGKPMVFMDTEGKASAYPPRNRVEVKDHIDELMNCEVESEGSNTLGVTGIRRTTEIIRPRSARRFPEKDFQKKTPRSVTPRAQSEARVRLAERPRWAK